MKQNRSEIWQAHIRQWERSGLSQRRYCEERELSLSTFQWWRSRLKKTAGARSGTTMVKLPLAVRVPVESGVLGIEVGRFTVTVRGNLDRELLGGVLDVLESR